MKSQICRETLQGNPFIFKYSKYLLYSDEPRDFLKVAGWIKGKSFPAFMSSPRVLHPWELPFYYLLMSSRPSGTLTDRNFLKHFVSIPKGGRDKREEDGQCTCHNSLWTNGTWNVYTDEFVTLCVVLIFVYFKEN